LIFVFISIDPPIILFSMASLYALSGPVNTVIHLRKRRAQRTGSDDSDEQFPPQE